MQCVHRLQVAWKGHEWKKKSTEHVLRDGRLCVLKMTIKDEVMDIFYTDLKNVNQTWCFKATEFKIYRNDIWALRQHIEFSRRFYSVANSAGKDDRKWEL